MRDFDDLIKDIDALVDWQLSDSPAAQRQSEPELYCCPGDDWDDGDWDDETIAEYLHDHPTESKVMAGWTVHYRVCKCPPPACKYVGSGV